MMHGNWFHWEGSTPLKHGCDRPNESPHPPKQNRWQTIRNRWVVGLSSMALMGAGLMGLAQEAIAQSADATPESLCPAPVLSRLTRYQTRSGDTIATLAQRHNLTPETLIGMNPVLRQGNPPAGTNLLIPPINGLRVEVPAGRT